MPEPGQLTGLTDQICVDSPVGDCVLANIYPIATDVNSDGAGGIFKLSGKAMFATETPNHILQDGTFVYQPPPTDYEITRYFERSVARHGLLHDDLQATNKRSRERDDEKDSKTNDSSKSKKKVAAPQIHPLALASARLQTNGINELNRAINLQTLVASGEYFGLSNIVDPSIDRVIGKSSSLSEKKDSISRGAARESSIQAPANGIATMNRESSSEDEARIRAMYILQRKRDIYHQAAKTLKNHRRRLMAAIVSQQRVDTRWRELRPFWRLAAPEHGTKAIPHAARATEIICADVDVYYNNNTPLGRIASHVPRYATLELSEDYLVTPDMKAWLEKYYMKSKPITEKDNKMLDGPMDIDDTTVTPGKSSKSKYALVANNNLTEEHTKAKPYAIADPTIGKLDIDFDPSKVSLLKLQFNLENSSTGHCESVCLEPMGGVMGSSGETKELFTNSLSRRQDENLLAALQHSLFCAKLFESMRRELAPDTESIGQVRTSSTQTQAIVWLSGQSDENFVPAPYMMIGSNRSDLIPLGIVHVHEGDFKVLLDCEYTLNISLVESQLSSGCNNIDDAITLKQQERTNKANSGSQTPSQLRILCRTLLLHAQDVYHRHSIYVEENEKLNQRYQIGRLTGSVPSKYIQPANVSKDIPSPKTLQNCISLGAKLLLESRIREKVRNVQAWLKTLLCTDETVHIDWLALSVFDLSSHFTMRYNSWYVDVEIACNELVISNFGGHGEYRKVRLHSCQEFELYIKNSLRRVVIASKIENKEGNN